jgi:hypothetical protein
MRTFLTALSFVLLLPLAAAGDHELRFESFTLRLGASVKEVVSALPEGFEFVEAPSAEGRQGYIAPSGARDHSAAMLTFDDGRLIGITRLVGPPDYSDQPATLLTANVVKTLADWNKDGPTPSVQASDLAEGPDIVQELVFQAGSRRLVLIRTHQVTQLVEHLGETGH